MHATSLTTTDEPAMFGPPSPSDLRGLVPTLAAIVRRIDAEQMARWLEQVKRSEVQLQALMRKIGRY